MCQALGTRQPGAEFMERTAVWRQTATNRSSKNTTIYALKAGLWEDSQKKQPLTATNKSESPGSQADKQDEKRPGEDGENKEQVKP